MANERELNKRIRSIGNISQVTSALAAVSAAKATKAQHQVIATRDYAGKAFEILINLASQPGVEGSNTHPLLTTRPEIKNSALIMVTGDRGLAGAYNANIVSRVEQFLEAITTPVEIIAVGRKGRDLMIRRGYNITASFDGIPDATAFLDVVAIARLAINEYLEGKVDDVFIAYTDFVSLATRVPRVKQLLPLKPLDLEAMAETIQIAPDASFEAVRRRIGRNRADRLVLELPDGWAELDNLARMRLLQRQAQIQGSELALVTGHEATRKAAKQAGWFDEVHLVVWGPSAKLLAANEQLQARVKAMQKAGVVTEACVACARMYGVADTLRELDLDVKGMGRPLSDRLQGDWQVITF